jgi:molecular chaperone HscA
MQLVEIQDHSYTIGIDLGTTNSLVAAKIRGKTQILPDKNGNKILPSVVSYNKDSLVAEKKVNSVFSFKKLMGKNIKEAKDIRLPFDLLQNPQNQLKIKINNQEFTPIELSAVILKELKEIAEGHLKSKVSKAVITVPAYFDEAARLATKEAAKIAGLEILRLLNEPTAAALAYGINKITEGIYLVYDLGGGTFDVSILSIRQGIFQVFATGGDTALGGDDFDYEIAQDLLICHEQTSSNKEMQELLREARNTRESLTSLLEAKLCAKVGHKTYQHVLTRSHFEKLIESYVDKTINIVKKTIKDAQVQTQDINGIILVGGATKTPMIRAKIAKNFDGKNCRIFDHLNPEEVVAIGAAEQADSLTCGSDNLLLDITPLSLGIETIDGLCEIIIHRNTPIPTSKSQLFTTQKDGQTSIMMNICQGESELVNKNRSLAKFELKGIPPMPAGKAKVLVTYSINPDGLLKVTAKEENTGIEQSIHVNHICDLQEIKSILESSCNT